METVDDDIYILSSHDTLDGSVADANSRLLAQEFVISRSPGSRQDPAVQALQQAYADLKNRYNETIQRNQQMSRALRDVGKLRTPEPDMATYGDHTDSFNSQGAAATGEQGPSDDNQRAQQGYIRYLEREKMNNEARLQQMSALKGSFEENCRAMQLKLKETVSDLRRKDEDLKRAHDTIKELKEENMQLKDDRDSFRKHASEMHDHMQNALVHSSMEKQNRELEELKVKYHQLEMQYNDLKKECDRLKVSEGLAQQDLQAANKKCQELQQSYLLLNSKYQQLDEELQSMRDSDLQSGSSMPTAEELVHLKKVITDLKRTVEHQRDFLRRIESGAMVTGKNDSSLGIPKRQANDEPILGPSWENVPCNPVPVYVKDGGEMSPSRNKSSETPGSTAGAWNTSPRRSNSANGGTQRASVTGSLGHSRSEVLQRRPSDNVPSSPRSKSEVVIRTNDIQGGNIRETSPLGDFTWQQQTVNNVSHMNGGTAQYQSTYDNTRQRTPQTVVPDNFRLIPDNTPAFPVPPELRHVSVGDVNGQESTGEKICPVCSRDFAAMPMEDFQTHVFECFDDQSAPETLRASSGQTERICPMCNALFPEAIPQEEFEKHVQGHFEQEIIERFEVLNP